VLDLAERKEKIKEANDVKESLSDDLDQATARSRTLDLSRVNNQLYQYFIEASWEGDNSMAKFEIYSFQIFCEI
jgi:predicted Holliday junction resolvase-like endonuclease